MEYKMGNVLGRDQTKFSGSTSVTSTSLQTPPRTPSLRATAAQALSLEICDIHHALSELPDLRPGDKINSLLTRLVNLCVVPYSTEFVDYFFDIEGIDSLCKKLRPLCAAAEGELEKFWASTILQDSMKLQATPAQTRDLLATFPYHQNYIDLSRIECATLTAFFSSPTAAPQNIAFIGSGPLPLTSLCILGIYPTAHVNNIDRDTSALALSQDLCSRLGYADRISFTYMDVGAEKEQEETKWADFDVVFLAALVGMDASSKMTILQGLVRKLKPGTLVVARSAKGLRGVLYPVLELGEEMERVGLEMLLEVHPWTNVVNSVILFRVKER